MKITSKRQTPDNHLYKTFRIVKDPGGDGWNVYDKDGELFDEGFSSLDDAKRGIDDELNLGYISGSTDIQDDLIANIYKDCSWNDACWEPDGEEPEQTAKIRYVPSLNKYEYISYSKWDDDTWIPSISIKKDTLEDVLEDVRYTFPNHPKHSINVYLTKADLNAATELSSIDMDKLNEIANRYCGSRPVSGDWATETIHEQNAISNELGVSEEEAKDLMIEYLGFDESQFANTDVDVSKVYEFLDECGGYSDYNQKVEDVMYEFGVDSETAENLVWDWTRRSDVDASVIMSTDSGDVYDTLEELSKCGVDINRRSDVIDGLKTYFRYGRDEIREFLKGYKDYLKSVRNGSRLAVASTDIECYSYAGVSVPLNDIRSVAKAAADVITADDLAKVVSSLKLIDEDYWKDVMVAWSSREYSPAALGKMISDDLYNMYLSVDSSVTINSSEDDYYTNLIDMDDKVTIDKFLAIEEIKNAEDILDNKDILNTLYEEYTDDYGKFPKSNSWDSYDSKYTVDRARFYTKWRPVIDKCKQIVKSVSISGYGRYDFFAIKLRDKLRGMEYNFPYGWKMDVPALSRVNSSEITSSTYVDVDGIIGEPGEEFNTAELKNIYDDLHNYDPVVMDYDSFEDWLKDSVQSGYFDVMASQSVTSDVPDGRYWEPGYEDANEYLDDSYEDYPEELPFSSVDVKKSITSFEETAHDPDIMSKLAKELKDKCHEVMTSEDYGWPEDEIDNYLVVEIEPTELYGDPYYQVEIRAELSYFGMEGLVDACNPIVEKYDPQAYFDHVTTGIIDAYIRMKTSVDSSTSIESADNSDEAVDEILEQLPQEFTSENTSINSTKLPAIFKLVHFEPGTINLDYGGGRFDNVADYLTQYDVVNLVYDPYNRSAEHNSEVVRLCKSQGGADTATCSNVLNVIKEPEVRLSVLRNMAKLVKPSGTIYITVYEGSGSGSGGETKSGYQLNRKTADYLDEIHEVFPDAVRKGKLIIAHPSNAVTSSEDIEAALVEPPQEVVDELISLLNDYGFVLDDRFAVNPGKTWMGNTHLQVINPNSYVDESADNLRDYIPRSMIDGIHQLEDSFNCPITWNFGPDEDGHVTGGLDINKQWVPDDVVGSSNINLPGYGVQYESGYAGNGVNHTSVKYFRTEEEQQNFVKELKSRNVGGIETYKVDNFYHTYPDTVEGADYGGTFDIDPELMFTEDDLVQFAKTVEEHLNHLFITNIRYTDIYMRDPNTVCLNIIDDEGHEFKWCETIHPGSINEPSDLINIFAPHAVTFFVTEIDKLYDGLDEIEGSYYGGAFDIDPEQFFTRDEYVEFAYEVEDRLNDMFGRAYNIHYTDVYALEPNTIYIEIEDKDGNMFTWDTKIDLRKIRKPSDLVEKYAPIAVSAISGDMKQWYSEYPIEGSQTVKSDVFRMPERNIDPPDYIDNNLEDIDDTIEFTLKGTLHVSDEDNDWSFELPNADSYAKDVLYEYEDSLYDLVDEVDIEEETEYLLTNYIPAESGDYDFEADIKLAYEITDLWENAYGEIISDDASIRFIYKKSDVNLKKCKKLD